MKKLLLLTVSVLLLFTACSPASLPEKEELDYEALGYEKFKDGVYAYYDRSKFENVTAPKRYYAEYLTVDESDLRSYFSLPRYIASSGRAFAATEHCYDFSYVFDYFFRNRLETSVEELDFMSLSEVNERFANDVHRYIPDFKIYDLYAIIAEEYAEAVTKIDLSDPERDWSEPKDFYFIRARQYVDDIPVFAGISVMTETLCYFGSKIEACYSEDGVEEFDAGGLYNVVEEAPVNGTFIDLSGAEQIIRDQYELIYPYDDLILVDCDLVYVAIFDEEGRTVLTPAWEFYEDFGSNRHYFTNTRIRINAYTGEFMRWS